MKRILRVGAALLASAALSVAGGLTVASASPAPALTPLAPESYYAQAYGSNLTVLGGIVHSGETALAQLSCTSLGGLYKTNSTAASNLGALGSLGVTTSHTATIANSTVREAAANNTVAHVNLLGGQITASAVTARSASERTSSGLSAHQSSDLLGLKIGGKAISASVPPNTTINLPFAQVILNQQAGSRTATYVSSADVAIRVHLLAGSPYGPAGTDLIVARAGTHLSPYQFGYLSGHAAGSYVNALATGVTSGFTANAPLACDGGSRTNVVATVNLGALGTLSGVRSTAVSSVSPTYVVGTTANTIASASILNDAIKAGLINTKVTASQAYGQAVKLVDGSSFGTLSVFGAPIKLPVAPNTTINVLGLGAVTFDYRTQTSHTMYVASIKITLNTQIGTLVPGTRILIGYATSSVDAPAAG